MRSPQTVRRLLIVVAFLPAACIALVAVFKTETPAQEWGDQQPFEFELVEKRFSDVQLFASREEAEALLGPPSGRAYGPEIVAAQERAERSNRHFGIPSEQIWQRWSDPKDEGRWVAVLYAGSYPSYKVYWKIKVGF
jgi:hypothetical protein